VGLLGFHAQIRGEVGFDLRVGFTGNISDANQLRTQGGPPRQTDRNWVCKDHYGIILGMG
jgi:hypothetical protein